MFWVYFDASALIKRYAPETGTPLVNEIFHSLPLSRMTCSTIGILEIISILMQNDELVLLTSDRRLVRAAQAESVIVFDPSARSIANATAEKN